uniref:Serpin family A member 4 n=1 Tax=Astyanax mexicanus TaxID=7994 RepID=A0A8B9LP42_ASTMX
MLINYIYFRGKWEEPFEVSLTHEFDFYVNENTKVTVDMMERTDQFDFYRDQENSTSIIKLPYKGNASMMIVLPDKGKMEELEKQISRDHFKNWEEKLSKTFVTLYMPRFKMSAFISLQETLQEMGMVEAFSGAADFSGLSEDSKLMLSKAVLKVNEEGTEADAALIVELRLLSGWLSEIMVLNRPFLVFILDSSTRSILFMGKVNNPTE